MRLQQLITTDGYILGVPITDNIKVSHIIFAVIFLFIAILIFMSFISKDVPDRVEIEKNKLLAFLVLINSCLILFSGIQYLIMLFGGTDVNYIKYFILFLASVLASIAMFGMACSFYDGFDRFKKMPAYILLPVVWATVRVVVLFIDNTSVACSYVEMFDLLSESLITLFLFIQAKSFEDIKGNNLGKKLFAYGLPAIVFSIAFNVPVLCQKIVRIPDNVSGYTIDNLIDISIAIYIAVFLISVTIKCNKNIVAQHIERRKNISRFKGMASSFANEKEEEKSKAVEDSMLRKNK